MFDTSRRPMVNILKTTCPLVLACLIALTSCQGKRIKYATVPGYELNKPITVNLKTDLDEISGLSFYEKDTTVFALNDEHGMLYKIYIRDNVQIDQWKFSNDADYEDLVLVDSTFYALHSNGDITRFRFVSNDSLFTEEINLPISGKNEFESIYPDPSGNKLVLICKDCKADKKSVSAYAFDTEKKEFNQTPYYSIDGQQVLNSLPAGDKKFKPSAAAIHPLTGELFIVSAVNTALVIADLAGKVKSVYALDPAVFKQPEGITFSLKGDLLISNEAAEVGSGNILIFKNKKQ